LDFNEAMERLADTEQVLEQLRDDFEQRIAFDYGAALLAGNCRTWSSTRCPGPSPPSSALMICQAP